MTHHSIILLIPYFGKWPEWFDLFLVTAENNSSVHFQFYTDCEIPNPAPANCTFNSMTFEAYVTLAQQKIGKPIQVNNPYKICDLRPFFGIIHQEDIEHYDFFGWTDVDILFGDIRSFYTNELLSKYDVFSTHHDRLSGHLAILRNHPAYTNKGYKIYEVEKALMNPAFVGIDEHGITNALTMTFWDKVAEKFKIPLNFFPFSAIKKVHNRRFYFVEQFTTPFVPKPWLDGSVNSQQPENWNYKNGSITNDRDGERKFIYLHFMNFKSYQWRHDGTLAPWEGKKCCFASVEQMKNLGLSITPKGIHGLETLNGLNKVQIND